MLSSDEYVKYVSYPTVCSKINSMSYKPNFM